MGRHLPVRIRRPYRSKAFCGREQDPPLLKGHGQGGDGMLRQDAIFALRSFARRPFQSTLRVAVLALGLFTFLLSYLVVAHFRSYDRQWAKADRTYAVFESLDWPTNRLHVPMVPNSTPLLAEQLRLDVPELESAARYRQVPEAFIELDGGTELPRQVRTGIAVADAELLDVFDFEVVAGDLRGALSRPCQR